MKIDKITTIINSEELEITGATLLSSEEVENLLTEDERKYDCWWWLRSPGYDSSHAADVNFFGGVDYNGDYVDRLIACVRPVLQIKNLKSSNLKIGDTFKIGECEFKIISENLAWMYKQDIDCYCFRKDWQADDANDYENSDVKKFVDEWFEKLVNRKED